MFSSIRSLAHRAVRRSAPSMSMRMGMSSTRSFTTTRALSSDLISQHKFTDYNNKETAFEWTSESAEKIPFILSKFPTNYKQSAVMPLLTLAQEQEGANNFLTLSAMNQIAEMLDMPPIKVYEVATFYSMYNREPVGKFHIQLCGTTHCMVCGSEGVKNAIEDKLNMKCGETSKDGLFTLTEVECLGACVNAPMVQVNNHEYYENLTPETTRKLIDDLLAGTAKKGPQNGQDTCEGPSGQTTLKGEQGMPPFRDIDALLKEQAE